MSVLARLRRFSQPSEVQEPIELIRAGIVFHARGLINTRAIQHNLDWVWPYWVQRQFNPSDISFIPRAFSLTHINLTHRNWTAVGHPHLSMYPLIDPRGLVTPFLDEWSLDFWIINRSGNDLLPSEAGRARQEWRLVPNLETVTFISFDDSELESSARVEMDRGFPTAKLKLSAITPEQSWLVVSIRPYNPEGVQFVERIDYIEQTSRWRVNDKQEVLFSEKPQTILHSTYHDGDVYRKIREKSKSADYSVRCKVGMATGAAMFVLEPGTRKELEISIPLDDRKPSGEKVPISSEQAWKEAVQNMARLNIPDKKLQFLFDAAVRTLILLSAEDIVPGPYTYKRFWFRDACLMLHAMLVLGCQERCAAQLDRFPGRQKYSGYFHSQAGEWDSNGQVLWIMGRYRDLTGMEIKDQWWEALKKGVRWIERKRLTKVRDVSHAGLMPAGFSAEHLGPNDYYYWDNFWSLAGLRAASCLARTRGDRGLSEKISRTAIMYKKDILRSISSIPGHRKKGGIPASPFRRMDAGAIGSLVADYPLQLYPAGHPEILNTARFLKDHCFYAGGFFQDMIHSGINPYLTLAIAQSLLRHGDQGFMDMVKSVAALASPTGQWPEAIHPITGGGCMGDGQHGWAAAEWIMMLRNMFVREEGRRLILCSGIFPEWITSGEDIGFGPAPTPWGRLRLNLRSEKEEAAVQVDAQWRKDPPEVIIALPGYDKKVLEEPKGTIRLKPEQK